jgi:hypothetical protein
VEIGIKPTKVMDTVFIGVLAGGLIPKKTLEEELPELRI